MARPRSRWVSRKKLSTLCNLSIPAFVHWQGHGVWNRGPNGLDGRSRPTNECGTSIDGCQTLVSNVDGFTIQGDT
jgi:hypothetical protein